MPEIAVRCLWHAFGIRVDDAALLSMLRALAPQGDEFDEVAVTVSLSVTHDSTDGYVLFDGPDRFAEGTDRNEACRLLVDRMSLRAVEMAHLKGWLPFRGAVRIDGAKGTAALVIAGPDLLSAHDWFLTDGSRVIDVGRPDELPTLTEVRLLIHWVMTDVAYRGEPLASIEATRLLVMQAGLVPGSFRRDVVRVATALASRVTAHSVSAGTLDDLADAVGDGPISASS